LGCYTTIFKGLSIGNYNPKINFFYGSGAVKIPKMGILIHTNNVLNVDIKKRIGKSK